MASINTGPAVVQTVNSTSAAANVNGGVYPLPLMQNAIRLLGSIRGAVLSVTGDLPLTLNNVGSFSVANIVVTNSQLAGVGGSIATASIGVFSGTGSTGTGFKAQAALASNTSQTVVFQATVASTVLTNSQALASPNTIYVNVGTALATATADIFVYGYDLT